MGISEEDVLGEKKITQRNAFRTKRETMEKEMMRISYGRKIVETTKMGIIQ